MQEVLKFSSMSFICLGLVWISLILGKSQRRIVTSVSMSILVLVNWSCHLSRTAIPCLIIAIDSDGGYLKITWSWMWLRTLVQISLEIDSRMSSNSVSVWLIWREIVQISLRPFKSDGNVSSICLRSPLEMFLNWRSSVVKNLTKSLALAWHLENSFCTELKASML